MCYCYDRQKRVCVCVCVCGKKSGMSGGMSVALMCVDGGILCLRIRGRGKCLSYCCVFE